MPQEMTAALWITPRQVRGMDPTHLLTLKENFRPVWLGRTLDQYEISASVVAGSPRNQLAVGLLSYLWMAAPALLAQDARLAAMVTVTDRGVTTAPLTTNDAHHVYAILGPLIRVGLSLHNGSCVRDNDIEHAQRCGLRLSVADGRRSHEQVSA